MTAGIPDRCPECLGALATTRWVMPWCPTCEWNLVIFDPELHGVVGWNWLDRRVHGLAGRLTKRQFAALRGRPLGERTGPPATRVALVVSALGLYAFIVCLFALGVWLTIRDFPTVSIILGVPLLLLAILLRPRFGRLDPYAVRLDRASAPTLFELVDRVADALKAPRPHVIALDELRLNAQAHSVGIRRRGVLVLGLPLWAVLPPAQRVALLAHELGHFVNGDVRRGLVVQPAYTTLRTLAEVFQPGHLMIAAEPLAERVARMIMRMVARLAWVGQLGLWALALRDSQRAEYRADELAAEVAGSKATTGLLDLLAARAGVESAIRRSARQGGEAAEWRAAAAEALETSAGHRDTLRQFTLRTETSMFATHPPVGLRAQLVESRPWRDGAMGLTETESERIDTELAKHYRRARKDIGQE